MHLLRNEYREKEADTSRHVFRVQGVFTETQGGEEKGGYAQLAKRKVVVYS